MKKGVVIGVLMVLVALPASAAAVPLPRFHSTLIVPGKSVGGVSIGESAVKAMRVWSGEPVFTAGVTRNLYEWGSEDNGSTGYVDLYVTAGKVVFITVGLPANRNGVEVFRGPLMKLKTKKGIGLKSDYAELDKAYPGQVKSNNGEGAEIGSGSHTTEFEGAIFSGIEVGNPTVS